MSPEVHFPVGKRTFDEVVKLVAQREIKLEPLTRFTSEKYPGATNPFPDDPTNEDYVDINGALWFKNELFPFTFQLVEGKCGSLSVDISDQKLVTTNILIEILNTIFPQEVPRRSRVVSTSSKVIWDKIPWGCLILSLLMGICLFFFSYGVYWFFLAR